MNSVDKFLAILEVVAALPACCLCLTVDLVQFKMRLTSFSPSCSSVTASACAPARPGWAPWPSSPSSAGTSQRC
jgi:hypothetical protein